MLANLYANSHDIDWTERHKPLDACQKVLELPAYAWDMEEFFTPYEGDWCLHRNAYRCEFADPNGSINHTGQSLGLYSTKAIGNRNECSLAEPELTISPLEKQFPSQ